MYNYTFGSACCKPGTRRKGTIYLPVAFAKGKPMAVQVSFDGVRDCDAQVLEHLMSDGAVPPLVSIGCCAASYPASLPGGTDRSVRSPEYDGLGPSLPNLLAEELIPAVAEALGITFSDDPNGHAVTGCSSGGIAAWNACWERNDFFRRCFVASPTFSSFRGGETFPFLIRKYETKPIRCYITAGTNDMRNSAGDWYLEAESAKEALEYAGYEYRYECFPGGEHGVGNQDPDVYAKAMRFVWQDWETRPVSVRHIPPRVADIVDLDSGWVETDQPFPAPPACAGYVADGCCVRDGSGAVVATLPHPVSSLALSSDLWRLYVGVPAKRFVYAFAIQPDGSLTDGYPHAHLHVRNDFTSPGAFGVAVDTGDRLYAATELGIQTISQQGENNTVLPLPGNREARKIAFGGLGRNVLFVETSDGRVFCRPTRVRGADGLASTPPNTPPF